VTKIDVVTAKKLKDDVEPTVCIVFHNLNVVIAVANAVALGAAFNTGNV